MFVVTVTFSVRPEYKTDFYAAVQQQARKSLQLEDECHVFDVSVRANDDCTFFLYEKYETEASFGCHLDSPHFKNFDEQVMPWVVDKQVDTWHETSLQ